MGFDMFATWLALAYYGGDNGFQDVYDMLDKACDKIVEQIA